MLLSDQLCPTTSADMGSPSRYGLHYYIVSFASKSAESSLPDHDHLWLQLSSIIQFGADSKPVSRVPTALDFRNSLQVEMQHLFDLFISRRHHKLDDGHQQRRLVISFTSCEREFLAHISLSIQGTDNDPPHCLQLDFVRALLKCISQILRCW